MKRPADAGKGLDGVVAQGAAATSTRPPTCSRSGEQRLDERRRDRPAVRRHHRRRHGAAVVHAAAAARQAGRGRRAAAGARRWAWTPRWSCTPRRWARTSRSSSCTARCNHLVDTAKVEVVEREYPLLTAKEVNAAIKTRLRRKLVVVGACIGTDAHTVGIDAILNIKGFAGEKGLEYYREIEVVNLGAQVLVPELVERARGRAGRRRPGLPGRHPARRAPAQHPGDVGGVPRGLPGRAHARCWWSAARASTRRATAELGVDRIFGKGHHPRRGGQLPRPRPRPDRQPEEPHDDPAGPATRGSGVTVTHRRYVPYSHAHYAGNLVDGAYVLALFGDVATELLHPDRRRRGPVRVVLGRPVRRAGAGPATSWRRRPRWSGSGGAAASSPSRRGWSAGPSRSGGPSAAAVLAEPLVCTRATGTVVVPAAV